MISYNNLARKIDHTNLRADATEKDIKKLCDEAQLYNFKCVCVNPVNVSLAVDNIKNHDTGVCTVVGFPLGAITTEGKAFITGEAVKQNAAEIDMVMNIGHLKSGRDELVFKDVQGVVEAANGKLVKVILETALLTVEEKVKASLIAKEAGADFVKTSTGSGGLTGATVEDVTLLKKTVGKNMGIKASGGIRDLKTVLSMLNAGADRIGTSGGVQIMKEHGDY